MSDQEQSGGDAGEQGDNVPRQYDAQPFPYRPFRFCQHAVRLSQRDDAKYDERKRYRDRPSTEMARLLAVCDYLFRRTNSNHWIAIFTAVLTATTMAQWWVMRAQNDIMETQIGQTDDTLKLMRIEQRAWLGAHRPIIEPFIPGEAIKCSVPVKNTGSTPGRIEFAFLRAFKKERAADIEEDVRVIFTRSKIQAQQIIIPPEGTTRIKVEDAPMLMQPDIASIEAGDWRLWIAGRLIYRDVNDAPHFTEFCFFFDPKDPIELRDGEVVGHYKYNDMD